MSFDCERCGAEYDHAEEMHTHRFDCRAVPVTVKKAPSTGDAFEKHIKESAKVLRHVGLHIHHHGAPFRGRHGQNGVAVGRITGKGGLDFEGRLGKEWLAFDAKSTTNETSFPMDERHIKRHQVGIIEKSYADGVPAFLLVEFSKLKRYFALDWWALEPWWVPYDRGVKGARCSIPLGAFFHAPSAVGRYEVRAIEVKCTGKDLDLVAAIRAVSARAGRAA